MRSSAAFGTSSLLPILITGISPRAAAAYAWLRPIPSRRAASTMLTVARPLTSLSRAIGLISFCVPVIKISAPLLLDKHFMYP
jgi:hypothetical protein